MERWEWMRRFRESQQATLDGDVGVSAWSIASQEERTYCCLQRVRDGAPIISDFLQVIMGPGQFLRQVKVGGFDFSEGPWKRGCNQMFRFLPLSGFFGYSSS
jgi:hypothetical protein